MAEHAISLSGVGKRYGTTVALDALDLTVGWGEVCGLLGPNGAGKTTALRILAGVLRPDAGAVALAGHDLVTDGLQARRALGFVPDDGALYGLLTVGEHLALVSDLHELDEGPAASRAEELLALFDIGSFVGRRIDTLSKGQRQKAALVAALLPDPRILLLDEPLSGLDARAARVLRDLLRGLADRGRAVLYSSHVLDVVERVCDRAVILDEGRIVADAPTSELLAASQDRTLESVFHKLTRAADLEGLADAFLDRP
jgi:ABC-2 type transport system ATP-binding protein